jgi:hypothetical protein
MDQEPDRDNRAFSRTRQMLAKYGQRLIVRHALLSLIFLVLYVLLTRPNILMESQLGFIVWYPANGLALALMLGISPWYAPLVCIADVMSGALIYHQPLASWGQAFGSPAHAAIYAAAAIILRGPLRIDLGLNHRRDVVRYVFVTLVAAVSSTIIGVAFLVADHTIHGISFGLRHLVGSTATPSHSWAWRPFCSFMYSPGFGASSCFPSRNLRRESRGRRQVTPA